MAIAIPRTYIYILFEEHAVRPENSVFHRLPYIEQVEGIIIDQSSTHERLGFVSLSIVSYTLIDNQSAYEMQKIELIRHQRGQGPSEYKEKTRVQPFRETRAQVEGIVA